VGPAGATARGVGAAGHGAGADGYDPAPIWPGGPDADGFAAIRLDPWRVQTRTAAATAAGEPYAVWQDG
jgi:hypothetical protein